ncbi:hypothetical protein INT43_003078, partial [Umbelopsis isabellina]
LWTEHTTPEGRKYWFNNATKTSTWEKPEDLLTEVEKALRECEWQEHTTPEGKKYYSHKTTKESRWVMPDEYKDSLEKGQQAEEAKKQASPEPPIDHMETDNTPKPQEHHEQLPSPAPVVPPVSIPAPKPQIQQPAVLEFATKEQAEAAFIDLLRKTGVKSDWTWEQTMRAIITLPMYRALKTLQERKTAFNKHIEQEARREKEQQQETEKRVREEFLNLLSESSAIRVTTRYRKAASLFGDNSAWTAITSERYRQALYDDYIHELARKEKDKQRELRKQSMDRFAELLRSIPEITHRTTWKQAQELYTTVPEFQDKEKFRGMDKLDFLAVFEDHVKHLEQVESDQRARVADVKKRTQRKHRDNFKALLAELRASKLINAKTDWMEMYPHIKDDARYQDMLGQPGSTPLDLFWDVVDELGERFYQQKRIVYDILKSTKFDFTPDTQYAEFEEVLKPYPEVAERVEIENLKLIFEHLQEKEVRRAKEDKRRREKKIKRRQDALKSAIKRLKPSVEIDSTWEDHSTAITALEEYQELADEDLAKEVFDKYIHRLKEKSEKKRLSDDDDEEGMIPDEDAEVTRRSKSLHKSPHQMPTAMDLDSNDANRVSEEEGDALDDYVKRSGR